MRNALLPLLDSPERHAPLPPFLRRRHSAPAAATEPHGDRQLLDLDPEKPWLLTVAMMRDDQKLLSYRVSRRGDVATEAEQPWQLVIAGAGPAEDRCARCLPVRRSRQVAGHSRAGRS